MKTDQVINQIEELLRTANETALKLALCEVRRLARDILQKHTDECYEFVMCNGVWFISNKKNLKAHVVKTGYRCSSQDIEREYISPLHNFIDKWGIILSITDFPMRFTANSDEVNNW